VNLLGHLQDEDAWVLEPPLDVRNDEASLCGHVRTIDLDLHRNRNIVRRTVQREDARNLNGRLTRLRNRSLVAQRLEGHVGIMLHVENLRVHILVAAFVAAVSAGS